ncbi:Lrp/AsnC ligand binding domain-containing protein [Jannaschia sp.]|nr:Lrp/AsnC ligand binding domain-containing protein [Jannaschia sp.]
MTDAFDRQDRLILHHLQADARMPITTLADRVGLSANATGERLRRLRQTGVITGYHARLSPQALGRGLTAFVEVKLERTDADVFAAFASAIRDATDIEECHMVAGGFDYLLKTRHRDMTAYRVFLSDTLLRLPGVRETHTYPVMEELRADLGPIVARPGQPSG